jgi:beta-lactamase class A
MSLWDALTALMNNSTGIYSACVWRDDDIVYEHNADAVHPAASLIKVPLCMAVWEAGHRQDDPSLDLAATVVLREQERVAGEGGFDQAPEGTVRTYRDLVGHALRESDNTAANALIDTLGMEQINAWMHGAPLGLQATVLRRRFMDWAAAAAGRENHVTAREMCQVFAYLLYEHPRYAALLDWLGTSPYDMKLVAGVPRGTKVAHKVGDLPGVEHDAGIVYAPTGPFVVALLGSALPDADTGTATLVEASRLIYEAMTQ